jgi:hypothetical protein
MKIKTHSARAAKTTRILIVFAFLFCFSGAIVKGQTPGETQNAATQSKAEMNAEKTAAVKKPVLTNLKEIAIGTAAKDVREKLGKAEVEDTDGFFYQISDNEMMQIRLDADKKVRLISATYTGEHKNAPKYADIFGAGADEAAATKPDGSVYHRVAYPEAGYWVAYSRTAGEKPLVTVTIQKL